MMRTHAIAGGGCPRRRAITLVEVILATLVVGVMMAGALATVSASQRAAKAQGDGMLAQQLAQDLLDEVMRQAYADASDGAAVNGPTASELAPGNRSLFNDVNDYKAWTESPPRLRDGTVITGGGSWTRSVSVEFLAPGALTTVSTTDQGVARITVAVKLRGGTLATAMGVRTSGLPATQACKLTGGTCADLTPARCAALGGSAQGVGTACWTLADPSMRLGLVANWKFDESGGSVAADSSTNNFDGKVNGLATFVGGQFGNSIGLNGLTQYVNSTKAGVISLNSAVTLSAWIYLAQIPGTNSYANIINKGTTITNWNFALDLNGRQLCFDYTDALGNQWLYRAGNIASKNTWYHVAATCDWTLKQVKLYVNGTLISTQLLTLGPSTNPDDVTIGKDPFNNYLKGRIDDARIYDRVLSDTEIMTLFNGGEP